ncbi:hypothetical protein B0O99DRAFT_681822 [Bisporella sp. PMI_857]|nr:hypothetical protein B0O99DRAFT_681822 [Bisporella sp. PMI_857]
MLRVSEILGLIAWSLSRSTAPPPQVQIPQFRLSHTITFALAVTLRWAASISFSSSRPANACQTLRNQIANMCGIRECLGLLQWMTGGKATKHKDGEEKDGDEILSPRPMKKESEKWKVDGGEKDQR